MKYVSYLVIVGAAIVLLLSACRPTELPSPEAPEQATPPQAPGESVSIAPPVLTPTVSRNMQSTRPSASLQKAVELRRVIRLPRAERKYMRDEFFFQLTRDPATNAIPPAIRARELAYARTLPHIEDGVGKASSAAEIVWVEAGPYDVGGRTRALAVDVTNSNIVLAGGVSGGIWKSTDGGHSWYLKTDPSEQISVTGLAQDVRPGYTRTWYAVSGEFAGNSGLDRGSRAFWFGSGFYRSTDGGETWTRVHDAGSPVQWDSNYDYASRVVVSPTTGSVFVAANGSGIFRSTDQGENLVLVLGGVNDHLWSDIIAGPDGALAATISDPGSSDKTPANPPGVYRSSDDGQTWTNVTPSTYPADQYRSVVAIAPSNPDIAYVMTYTGKETQQDARGDVRLHWFNFANGSSDDRSANLPQFEGRVGKLNMQGGYNMVIAVKPDDEEFVLLGGTNLYRSRDGFKTSQIDLEEVWIGGYPLPTQTGEYENHHADQHALAFDPRNPNRLWSGHDGGLSLTSNVGARPLVWEDMNNGYNVTQFYTVALPPDAGDNRLMGGTQDNGTPFLMFGDGKKSTDISGGDGAYAYFGRNHAYVSAQKGYIFRLGYGTEDANWSLVYPRGIGEEAPLFIHPFVVDPNDEDVMYFPEGGALWRNDRLSSIPLYEQEGTTIGWTKLDALALPMGYQISTLSVSRHPAHILYYAGSSWENTPLLFKLSNSHTATYGAIDISIPSAPPGSYVHGIAVNPEDADEVLVVMSNYNIIGLYHTSDGGLTWQAVEGNLEGNSDTPGPSLRSATILPLGGETIYYIGTSTGLYSTSRLEGASTRWVQQASALLGNVIVESVVSRPSDGRVAVGTHGRGLFVGTHDAQRAIASVDATEIDINVPPGEINGTSSFTLRNLGEQPLEFSITAEDPVRTNQTAGLNTLLSRMQREDLAFRPVGQATSTASKAGVNVRTAGTSGPAIDGAGILQDDWIILDDGNDTPSDFIGYGPDDPREMIWYNIFPVNDSDFDLEQISFYMRTESIDTNRVRIMVYDKDVEKLAEGELELELAPEGKWFYIDFKNAIRFERGTNFFIMIQNLSRIPYPSGADQSAQSPGNSFWWDYTSQSYKNLNEIDGYSEGAFLIRAGGQLVQPRINQPPLAKGTISKLTARVGEEILFDGSSSSDADGQIISYEWNFGDGTSASGVNVKHVYSVPGAFTVSLTVTDNEGATGRATGSITINGSTQITIFPANGTVIPGGERKIQVTADARGLEKGTYSGRILVESNGGRIVVPYWVSVGNVSSTAVEELDFPGEIALSQAYPNPFHSLVTIHFVLHESGHVTLRIFDALGREVETLVNGTLPTGSHDAIFNAEGIPSGLYFYRLTVGDFSRSGQMIRVN